MQTCFDRDLVELKERLLTMASHAEWAVTRSVKAFVERDDDLTRQVTEEDDVIDRYEIDVDELSLFLLAKAPLAADLRLIAATMKISRDLERIGDEATTIARRALELNQEPPLPSYLELPEIAVEAMQMLNSALAAFVQRTVERAQRVVRQDQGVDALNTKIHGTLAHWMIERPDTITRCLNLMVISKSLERIADHAVNIAVEVVHLYECRNRRHLNREPLVPA